MAVMVLAGQACMVVAEVEVEEQACKVVAVAVVGPALVHKEFQLVLLVANRIPEVPVQLMTVDMSTDSMGQEVASIRMVAKPKEPR